MLQVAEKAAQNVVMGVQLSEQGCKFFFLGGETLHHNFEYTIQSQRCTAERDRAEAKATLLSN